MHPVCLQTGETFYESAQHEKSHYYECIAGSIQI